MKTVCLNLFFSDLEVARALGNAKPPHGVRVSVGKHASISLSSFDLVLLVSFHVSGPELGVVAAWTADQIRQHLKKHKKQGTQINAHKTRPTNEEILRLMQDVIKGQKQKKRTKRNRPAHSRTTCQPVKKALKQLINALDKICDEHEEVGDTAVREQMHDAVHKGFIVRQPRYKLPAKFGMFSDEGNKLVRVALEKFLEQSDVSAASKSLKTPEKRLAAFQDSNVESSEGNTYDEYFGYA
jgi:hypothetical protein